MSEICLGEGVSSNLIMSEALVWDVVSDPPYADANIG